MYSVKNRISYSEVGVDQKLSVPALVNYFQDCSTFHSQDIGVGTSYLAEKKKAWLLSFWQIIIEDLPSMGDEVEIETRPYSFERFYGKRNFALKSASGEYMVKANSIWFFFNSETGRPERPAPEEIAPYGIDEALEMDYAPGKKIALPEQMEERDSFPVRKTDIDTNNHVNNGQYIRMAAEYFPEGQVRELRAEYRIAARYGETVYPKVGMDGQWTVISLDNEDGKPYAIVAVR